MIGHTLNRIILGILIMSLANFAGATCTRIYLQSQISAGDGTAKEWISSAVEGYSGDLGLPPTIYLNTTGNFQPDGTVLATGSASFVQSATTYNGGYTSEQVLFRCDAADENSLYELYATNGDYIYGGMYEDGAAAGIAGGYATTVRGMLARFINQKSGEVFSKYWKGNKLTDLDKDSQGRLLVKAKNFSGVNVELIRLKSSRGENNANSYTYPTYANAYTVFSGPGISAPAIGSDSQTNYQGFYGTWPAVWSLYKTKFQRIGLCGVRDFTSSVRLPSISVTDLNQGGVSSADFNVNVECDSTATGLSGTTAGRIAIGFLQPTANVNTASQLGLVNGSGGVSHLLADDYGSSEAADGVGIRIYRKNQPINFLSNEATQTGNAGGWYGVLDGATLVDSSTQVFYYNETFRAQLEKISGQKITGGSVNAHAQVIVRVQ